MPNPLVAYVATLEPDYESVGEIAYRLYWVRRFARTRARLDARAARKAAV